MRLVNEFADIKKSRKCYGTVNTIDMYSNYGLTEDFALIQITLAILGK